MFRGTQVRRYLKLMADHGIPPRQLLAGTGLDADRFESTDAWVIREQYQALVANIYHSLVGQYTQTRWHESNEGHELSFIAPCAAHLQQGDEAAARFCRAAGGLPDLEEASEKLGMSVSTLRRKLESAGLRYQSIKDEFRHDPAREYLRSGRMSPKQVAYLLGFDSPSNFSRAFKAWSGETVRTFLRAQITK